MSEPDSLPPQTPPEGAPPTPQGVLQKAGVPLFYFNGFALQYGTGDFTLALKVDNQSLVALKMSYTVGKSLSQALEKLVAEFERITAHEVMTSDNVKELILSDAKKQNTKSTT